MRRKMKVEIGPLNNGTLVFSDKITTCQVKTKTMIVRLISINIIMIFRSNFEVHGPQTLETRSRTAQESPQSNG